MILVVIVDDDAACVALLQRYLSKHKDILLVGAYSSGEDLLKAANEINPDIVLMDHKLPGADGIEIATRLKQLLPLTKVIMLTAFESPAIAERAVRAGVDGFLLKDDQPRDKIPLAITRVHAGEVVLTSKSQQHIIERFRWFASGQEALWPKLTSTENQVFLLCQKGMGTKEIADTLKLSENTVENHLRHIRKKSADCSMSGIIHFRSMLVA